MKRLCLLGLSVMLLASIAMAYFAFKPLHINAARTEITITARSSLRDIAKQLVAAHIISEPWRFIVLAKILGKETVLRAGNYTFNRSVNPYHIILSLYYGQATQSAITFIEGQTFVQMQERMKQNSAIKFTMNPFNTPAIVSQLRLPYANTEGLFFPDTYYFERGTTDVELLQRSHRYMMRKLAQAWQARSPHLPYKEPYQALIMASLIEKETGKSNERAQIASVFINRLKLKMRLQTDPAVIYGMGKTYQGNLSKRDLLQDTPYNTYTRNGLPPTPIAMPGWASIMAALHPSHTRALYFVGRGDGSHVFSNTLADHNRAVLQFQIKPYRKLSHER